MAAARRAWWRARCLCCRRCSSLIALSWVYVAFGDVPLVAGIFYGIKPAVAAIVLQAVHRIGSKSLRNPAKAPIPWAVAAISFIANCGSVRTLSVGGAGRCADRLAVRAICAWPFAAGGAHGSAKVSYGRR